MTHSSVFGAPLPRVSKARNEHTSRVYENTVHHYLSTTPRVVEGDMKRWINQTVHGLKADARILEVGTGSGRDADYIESLGLSVQRTDKTVGFVRKLRERGFVASQLDAVTDPFPAELDLVFANAVVCHFDKHQFRQFLRNAEIALVAGGRLSFSTKKAKRYAIESQSRLGPPRPFSSWPLDELVTFVEQAGFEVEWTLESGGLKSRSRWLNIVAVKCDRADRLF